MGLLDRLLRASWLSRTRKGLEGMVDLNQSRQVTAEAIAEKARHAQDHGGCRLDELQSTGKRPGPHKGCQDEAKLGGETDPHPLPPVLASLRTFAIRAGLLGLLAPNEAPHFIELPLGDGQVAQRVGIDLM